MMTYWNDVNDLMSNSVMSDKWFLKINSKKVQTLGYNMALNRSIQRLKYIAEKIVSILLDWKNVIIL